MTLKPGDKAPDFSLIADDKSEISLQNFKGQPVVILFFPLAFTNVCTTELCSVRDNISYYNNLNAKVLAISVDSPFTLEKFKAEQSLNFPLLSDFNKETSQAYGAIYEKFVLNMKGVSRRSAFVVDGDGVIRYAEVLDNAGELPNFEAIRNTLESL